MKRLNGIVIGRPAVDRYAYAVRDEQNPIIALFSND
jgi:hypothetical protein